MFTIITGFNCQLYSWEEMGGGENGRNVMQFHSATFFVVEGCLQSSYICACTVQLYMWLYNLTESGDLSTTQPLASVKKSVERFNLSKYQL